MEAVHQTNDKNMSTITLSTMETYSTNPTNVRTWSRTQQSWQYLHLLPTAFIQAATQLLNKEPSFNGIPVSSKCMKRSLLPFLGDALSWLTGTATIKDVNAIKTIINHLISTQQSQ